MKNYLYILIFIAGTTIAASDNKLVQYQSDANVLNNSQDEIIADYMDDAHSLVDGAALYLQDKALLEDAEKLVSNSEKHISSYRSKNSESTSSLVSGIDLDQLITKYKNPFRQKADNDASKPLPSLLVFVSLGMPEQALYALAEQTAKARGSLVLRGFYGNRLSETLKILRPIVEETGVNFLIDPTLYRLFSVVKVPEIIVVTEPLSPCDAAKKVCDRRLPTHDRMRGNVTLYYALEQFVWQGDAKDKALEHLNALQSDQWNDMVQEK